MLKWKWGKPLNSNFSNEFQNGFIETNADAGLPFRRMRYSDVLDIIRANFDFTKSEYLQFMNWYKYDTQQGSIPFTYYDCRIDYERTARIMGKPQYSTNSNRYIVSITLGLEPVTIYRDSDLIVNANDILIVNDNDVLVATTALRY